MVAVVIKYAVIKTKTMAIEEELVESRDKEMEDVSLVSIVNHRLSDNYALYKRPK